jgi:hypothetical protein
MAACNAEAPGAGGQDVHEIGRICGRTIVRQMINRGWGKSITNDPILDRERFEPSELYSGTRISTSPNVFFSSKRTRTALAKS